MGLTGYLVISVFTKVKPLFPRHVNTVISCRPLYLFGKVHLVQEPVYITPSI